MEFKIIVFNSILSQNISYKIHFFVLNKTPLGIAVEKNNSKIVELLLQNENIDTKLQSILIF